MKQPTERATFFDQLKTGLDECLAHARGELSLRTTVVPRDPPQLSPQEIARLREGLHLSQNVFARILNVSLKAVRSWEQGEHKPSQAALRLLQVMQSNPEVVCQAAGLGNGAKTKSRKSAAQ